MSGILPRGVHAPGLTPEVIHAAQEQLGCPEGTLEFRYHSPGLFNPSLGAGIIFQIPAGNTLFRLERDDKLCLKFIHSSPGTGTRVAEVDLHGLEPVESVRIRATWSSQGTALYVGYADKPCQPIIGKGYLSKGRTFRVGEGGRIYQIGDDGVQIMGISVFQGGHQVLQETALNSWSGVVEAAQLMLMNSRQGANYLFEVVVTNQVLVMLVTGFETYCQRRFLEMEMEGRAVDFEKLAKRFYTKREIKIGVIEGLKEDAHKQAKTPTSFMVEQRRIDFGNFDKCKNAYSAGYNVSFGRNLNISNQVLEFIQRIIKYRHRIVHVSPMIAMLNQGSVPPEEPVFSKMELGQEALEKFDKFIHALHHVTLKVPPYK